MTAGHSSPRFRGQAIRHEVSTQRSLLARRLIAGVVAALCGWIAYAQANEWTASRNLDSLVSRARAENASLTAQRDGRRREIAQTQSQAWLEAEARRLGLVMPGEQVYVLTTPGVPAPAGGGIDMKQLPSFTAPASPSPGLPATVGSPSPSPASSGINDSPAPTPFTFLLPVPRR